MKLQGGESFNFSLQEDLLPVITYSKSVFFPCLEPAAVCSEVTKEVHFASRTQFGF